MSDAGTADTLRDDIGRLQAERDTLCAELAIMQRQADTLVTQITELRRQASEGQKLINDLRDFEGEYRTRLISWLETGLGALRDPAGGTP